jgi:hypothetical protein
MTATKTHPVFQGLFERLGMAFKPDPMFYDPPKRELSDEKQLLNAMLEGTIVSSMWGRDNLNSSDVRKYISNLVKKGWVIEKAEECNGKKRYMTYFILEKNRLIK